MVSSAKGGLMIENMKAQLNFTAFQEVADKALRNRPDLDASHEQDLLDPDHVRVGKQRELYRMDDQNTVLP